MATEKKIEKKSYGIKSAIIVDDDMAICKAIQRQLGEMDVKSISVFQTGTEAWNALKSEENKGVSIFILDWKLPDLSGLTLFNRIRHDSQFQNLPILVISGYLQRDDFRLLEEFPFTEYLSKPFVSVQFLQKVVNLRSEYEWFEKKEKVLLEVFQSLLSDGKKALEAAWTLISTAPKPVPLTLSAARLLMSKKHYKEAEMLLRALLKRDPNCLVALNELAKIFLQEKRHVEAKRALLRAYKLSPQNLERLCLLGNASLNLMEVNEARQYFQKATSIDGENDVAIAGNVLVKSVEEFGNQNSGGAIPMSFASMLNSIGISLVKTGQFDKGIEFYRSALLYVAEGDSKAKLAFNLGLGYLRWDNPTTALEWFQKSNEFSDGNYEKAQKHADRINLRLKIKSIEAPGSGGSNTEKSLEPLDLGGFEEDELTISEEQEVATGLKVSVDSSGNSGKAEAAKTPEKEKMEKIDSVEKVEKAENFAKTEAMSSMLIPVEKKPVQQESPVKKSTDPLPGTIKDTPGTKIGACKAREIDQKMLKSDPVKRIADSIKEVDDALTDREKFLKEVPRAKDIVRMLNAQGEHVESHIGRILKLMEAYGKDDLKKAIDEALQIEAPSSGRIGFILQKNAANGKDKKKAG